MRPFWTPLILVALLLTPLLGFGPSKSVPPTRKTNSLRLASTTDQLPLAFEENHGQADGAVRYVCHGPGYTLVLTDQGALLRLRQPSMNAKFPPLPARGRRFDPRPTPEPKTNAETLRLEWVGASHASLTSEEPLPGHSNYFMGNDRSKWITGLAQYAQVRASSLYPGIDLVYYGRQRRLEFDLVVGPGADPSQVRFRYEGEQDASVNAQGDLKLTFKNGILFLRAPSIYQEASGQRQNVEGHYRLNTDGSVGFAVGTYDKTQPLVIDPPLDYSSYLGGGFADDVFALAVDTSGCAYVTGENDQTTNFPTTAGAVQTSAPSSDCGFVTKFSADGSQVLYSTYFGGSTLDRGLAIAVDPSNCAYVTGFTRSADFPVTPGAFITTFSAFEGAFAFKLNPTGTAFDYSTYLWSSSGFDYGFAIQVDKFGNAYVAGQTSSTTFAVTAGSYQTVHGNVNATGILCKLNPTGTALVYGTYLGGSTFDEIRGLTLDANDDCFVTGVTDSSDYPTTSGAYLNSPSGGSFVTELNTTASALVYSTLINTNGGIPNGIAVDAQDNAYVTGVTDNSNLPTTAGAFQTADPLPTFATGFITKLDPTGSALVYSTYLGGYTTTQTYSDESYCNAIVLDGGGNAYVTGYTYTSDFPTTSDALQTVSPNINACWPFLTELNNTGSALIYSTYLGGTTALTDVGAQATGIALDPSGNVYIAGSGTSSNFPTTSGAYQTSNNGVFNSFVAKFDVVTFATATPTMTNSPTATNTSTVTATHTQTASPTGTTTPVPFTPAPTSSSTASPTPTCVPLVWPDPFNPQTAHGHSLKVGCVPLGGTVFFYTLAGELVAKIPESGGMVDWNGRNENGLPVATGIYFYVIQPQTSHNSSGKFLLTNLE